MWEVVIEKAIRDDGSLLFPEKLSHEFLNNARRTMGSYLFANQYMNEVIPKELQTFKKEWFHYYDFIPQNHYTFVFIDPAISQADSADYTGVVVVGVDHERRRYVKGAKRYKITPTQIISLIFELNETFKPQVIGIEEVAYQKALLYFLDEEMRRRKVVLPVKGVKPPTDKTKQARILSMVPTFEWNRIFLSKGLDDLEMELLSFPRGKHDDLIDALASIDYIYYAPEALDTSVKKPHTASDPNYERWYIQNKLKGGPVEQAEY